MLPCGSASRAPRDLTKKELPVGNSLCSERGRRDANTTPCNGARDLTKKELPVGNSLCSERGRRDLNIMPSMGTRNLKNKDPQNEGLTQSGDDGTRTRDLGLDRAAC